MKFIIKIIIASILISCAHDNKSGELSEHKISFSKIDEVVLQNKEPIFGRFLEIFQVSKDGQLFIFNDMLQQKIYLFDSKGKFINRIGESGKGPKGIVNISGFDFIDSDKVLIYDSSQQMFKSFSIDGSLEESISFENDGSFSIPPYQLKYFEGKIFTPIIESKHLNEPQNSKLIAEIDIDATVDTLFGRHDDYAAEDNHYNFKNILTVDESNNKIYTSLTTSPFIQEYDINKYSLDKYFGEKTQSHKIPENEITRFLSISEVQKRATNTSSNFSIHTTTDYIILHRQVLTKEWMNTSFLEEKKNVILIYDKESYKLIDEIGSEYILGAVQNNKLYFIEDLNPDNYTIGVYEIITDQK